MWRSSSRFAVFTARVLVLTLLLLLTLKLANSTPPSTRARIQINNGEEFAALGWVGPYESVQDAGHFPDEMPADVRSLSGMGFWYYYVGDGSPEEVKLVWRVWDEVLNSADTTIQVRYYTQATVTLEPVEDVYIVRLETTEDSVWGTHSSSIALLEGQDEITFSIMPGPGGYMIFDEMVIEYDGPLPPTNAPTPGLTTSELITEQSTLPTTESQTVPTSTTNTETETPPVTSEEPTRAPTSTDPDPAPTTGEAGPSTGTTPPTTTTTTTEPPWETDGPTASSDQPTMTSVTDDTESTTRLTPTPTLTPLPLYPGDPCVPILIPCDLVPHTECVRDSESSLPIHRCTCVRGTDLSLDGRRCLPKATHVDAGCETDLQCSNLQGTWCTPTPDEFGFKYCSCLPEHVASSTRLMCLPLVGMIGLPCMEHVQCTVGIPTAADLVECIYGTCHCPTGGSGHGHVPSRDRLKCLNVSHWQEPCEESVQCIEGLGRLGACDADNCACRPTAYFMGTACHYPVPLGGQCTQNEECVLGARNSTHAICDGSDGDEPSHCACVSGSLIWNFSCYADHSIGDACEENEECTVPIHGPVICDPVKMTCSCTSVNGHMYEGQPGDKICVRSYGIRNFMSLIVSTLYIAIMVTICKIN